MGRGLFSALLFGVAISCSVGCGGYRVQMENQLSLNQEVPVPVLLMSLPTLNMEAAPAEVFIRTHQVATVLSGEFGLPIVEPWEIELEEGDPWPWGNAHLAELAAQRGFDIERVYVLELHVSEDRVTREASMVRMDGERNFSESIADVEVTLILRHPREPEPLQMVRLRYHDDGSVYDMRGYERYPLLVDAIDQAARRMGQGIRRSFPAAAVDFPFVGVSHPDALFGYGGGYGEALTRRFETLSPIEAQMERELWSIRLLGEGSAERYRDELYELSQGVLITENSPDGSLRRGDLVVGINGDPVWTTTSLQRAFLLADDASALHLDIVRDGEVVGVAIGPTQWSPQAKSSR